VWALQKERNLKVLKPVKSLLMNSCLHVLIFLLAGFVIQLPAQNRCDPTLPLIPNNPLSYHDLGDRCEGIYIEQVGGTTLRVVSLTEFFGDYNLQSGKPLSINWDKPPGNNVIRLRAQSIKRKLYYRMDTYCLHDSISFKWSSGILSSLNILKNDIAVEAITKYLIGKTERDVYLPVRIIQETKVADKRNYNLVLLPGEELSEVYISIAKLDIAGRQEPFIKNGEKLGYGYYPADRSIEIPVTGLKDIGTYYMQIGATLRSGGTASIEFWFYNPHSQN
jgi:hypothetical protein